MKMDSIPNFESDTTEDTEVKKLLRVVRALEERKEGLLFAEFEKLKPSEKPDREAVLAIFLEYEPMIDAAYDEVDDLILKRRPDLQATLASIPYNYGANNADSVMTDPVLKEVLQNLAMFSTRKERNRICGVYNSSSGTII